MRSKTSLFIGISALIHLSVLALISDQINIFNLTEQGRSNFSIIITPTNNNSDNTKTKSLKSDANIQNNSSKPNHQVIASKNTTPILEKHISTPTIKSPPPYKEKEVNSIQEIKSTQPIPNSINSQKIESIIKSELSKHFYYPRSAQRKNWQGIVILSFTILPNGIIEKIQINKSSGYSLLDNAAIDALSQIKQKKELSLALSGSKLEQLLPVNYKLTY